MNTSFHAQALTPAIGLEITDMDISTLDQAGLHDLQQLGLKHHVIAIRNQKLSVADLVSMSRRWGELIRLPYIEPMPGFPEVIRVLKRATDRNMGVFGGDWHTDFSFLREPPAYSILLGDELPTCGGDTLWSNMQLAYEHLDRETQQRLLHLKGVHVGAPYGIKHAPKASTQFKGAMRITRNNPGADCEVMHPLVTLHPESHVPALFINPTYTRGIENLTDAEACPLLQMLYRHCTKPEFCCRLQWTPGTVVIWDNRSTMHYAVNDYDGYRRCMCRTTIKGGPTVPATKANLI